MILLTPGYTSNPYEVYPYNPPTPPPPPVPSNLIGPRYRTPVSGGKPVFCIAAPSNRTLPVSSEPRIRCSSLSLGPTDLALGFPVSYTGGLFQYLHSHKSPRHQSGGWEWVCNCGLEILSVVTTYWLPLTKYIPLAHGGYVPITLGYILRPPSGHEYHKVYLGKF